ncbi:heat shock cognate 70 kDa protein-like protein [Tanacetum coccineum]
MDYLLEEFCSGSLGRLRRASLEFQDVVKDTLFSGVTGWRAVKPASSEGRLRKLGSEESLRHAVRDPLYRGETSGRWAFKGTAIGIDLGTTYSCAAIWIGSNNRVEIIPNEQGNRITSSCVAFSDSELLVVEYKGKEMKFPPEELSAMVLKKMKETAEDFLGKEVKNAVITVPAVRLW